MSPYVQIFTTMFVVTMKAVSVGSTLAISAIALLLVKTCRRLTRWTIKSVGRASPINGYLVK
ncbi:hypothetical protein EJD97_008599 [Solanum chilense]|uniref:Uncharacterized protein n=1 Tax=Solanum chilense TaxID=4083 RepID=A0A6N2AIS2_SOLCI|nr:hypothetical protein EJD97_008599 [Solanum chilense]